MNRLLLAAMLVASSFLVGAGCEYGDGDRHERWDRDGRGYYDGYHRDMDRDRDSGYRWEHEDRR
jgi:hypothetical protein